MRAWSWSVVVVTAFIVSSFTPVFAQQGPISASRFSLTIDGYEIATFSELGGINSEIEPSEYWEAKNDEVQVRKLPGKTKPPTITLKRGATGSLELWTWHEAVRTGKLSAARRSCSLTMYNADGQPVAKYWLSNAWPSKLELAASKRGRRKS